MFALAKKILFCASTASHIKNFHMPYLSAFADCGYAVFTATGDDVPIAGAVQSFTLPFFKSFLSPGNIRAIFAARRLLEKERFDIVSLHTTLAAAVLRAALLTLPKGRRPRVFYTCHGYLFNENDGVSRLKYLWPEQLCAGVTDVLMVMNREDERIARRHRLSKGGVYYINGMGLAPGRFVPPTPEQHAAAKAALGFSPKELLFVYIAEFSKRKNHRRLLTAFASAARARPELRLLLAGTGALLADCKALAAALNIADRVHFLGYVTDTPALLAGCDFSVSTSLIEGLPFNILEALSSGLPVFASDIKGHRELAEVNPGLTLFASTDDLVRLLTSARPAERTAAPLPGFMLPQVLPQILKIYLGPDEKPPGRSENHTKAGVD